MYKFGVARRVESVLSPLIAGLPGGVSGTLYHPVTRACISFLVAVVRSVHRVEASIHIACQ